MILAAVGISDEGFSKMKRLVMSTLAMGLIVALGMTACSDGTVDSAEAFAAAMDAGSTQASPGSP
jgi:hypothetical protein